MKKSFFFTAALVALAACTHSQEIDIPDSNLTLIARTETSADSKTVVEGGTHVYWEPGDEIMVFNGEKSAKFVSELAASSATATFKGTFGEEIWSEDIELWAVYPFSEDAVFDGGMITTVLPSEQTARAGSFGKDMNLAIAHSTSSTLQFFNVGGGIRFSVTEEGIKKVMFEGLNGEIISGKVKIGFDENGLPKVEEVISGSQFITLLPPEGSETFEKDTWYYIVAIPGGLEKGYKLRFYKDDDYARKVSEKAVQIKRSIYGNIEKADEGIGYEPQKIHFPGTSEEWIESEVITNQITPEIDRILYSSDFTPNEIDKLIERIKNVDGVLEVKMNSSETAIGVMQKDSLWINFLLVTKKPFIIEKPTTVSMAPNDQNRVSMRKSLSTGGSFYYSSDDSYYLNSKKKALILAPFQHSFDEDLSAMEECLMRAGFLEENIDVYQDRQALITYFKGDFLGEYDFILITTHGGTFYYMRNGEDSEEVSDVTSLLTYVDYSGSLADSFIANGLLNEEDIAIACVDDNDDGVSELYFAMTPRFLADATFNSSSVFLCACHSAEISDKDNPGSMVWRFLNQGAGFVSGNNNTTNATTDTPCVIQLLELVSRGLSLQDASDIIKNSTSTKEFCDNWYDYAHTIYPERITEEERFAFEYYNLFHYFINPALQSSPSFYVDPFSNLLKPEINSERVSFSWDTPLSSFELTWEHPDPLEGIMFYSKDFYLVNYDFVIDDARPNDGINLETPSYIWNNPSLGDHTWCIRTKIWQNGEVVGQYQSKEDHFTVTEELHYETPGCIDLDLPSGTQWASFNMGATKPEEYGDYFAWGEIEPYYSSLNPLTWKSGKEIGYYWDSYKWCMGDYQSLTKYCNKSSYGYNGFVDYRTILDPNDDVARVILGEKWRIPTKEEWAELRNNCSWEWITQEGNNGYKVTGKNGKFIFLPAAGSRAYSYVQASGSYGYYGSSSLYTSVPSNTNCLFFTSSNLSDSHCGRYLGVTIRPVYGDAISVESVTLNLSQIDLIVGTKNTLTATILPENAANKDYFWSSNNPSIATVSPEGVVTGVAVGTASISVTTYDGEKTATCLVSVIEQPQYIPSIPEAIDLGLSVKWGSMNLGATKPEEHGDYFAWGETEPYYFSLDPLVWKPGKEAGYTWQSYKWWRGSEDTIAKYNASDGKTELDPEDDAAHMTLGDKWRMPIKAEWEELLRKCSTEWISVDGISVLKVTGPNGNCIYIPSGGDCYETYFRFDGYVYCWLPTINPQNTYCANHLFIEPGYIGWSYMNRCGGHTIRPVYGDRKILSEGDIEGTVENPWN